MDAGRVLVIEDDSLMRLLETRSLQSGGWLVSEASTGREGVAVATDTLPEVIICDVLLPDIDGIAVISALAQNPSTASIPVVLVTGKGGADDIVAGIDAGAHDYLVKPFRVIELEVRCRAALRVSRQHRLLTRSEQRWRTSFERAPVGMAQIGIDGRFLCVNPALCDLFGYTSDQLLAKMHADISHPDNTDRADQAIAHLAANAVRSFRAEKRYLHAGGDSVWCSVSAVQVHGNDGLVDHILVHFLDISQLKRLESDLQHLADHDPLTGLLNRRPFNRAFADHVDHVNRYGPGGALLVLDLDGLKVINDSFGHDAGDGAITTVADILQRCLRSGDTSARLGGDEFAVILPHADRDQATSVAAMLVSTIRAADLTASIGVAMFDTPGRTGPDVLADADRAMYAAKNAGRNRFVISGPGRDPATGQVDAA